MDLHGRLAAGMRHRHVGAQVRHARDLGAGLFFGLFFTVKALRETAAARSASAVNAVEEKEIKELEHKLRSLWRVSSGPSKQPTKKDQEAFFCLWFSY